jgi:hypothetical protein
MGVRELKFILEVLEKASVDKYGGILLDTLIAFNNL